MSGHREEEATPTTVHSADPVLMEIVDKKRKRMEAKRKAKEEEAKRAEEETKKIQFKEDVEKIFEGKFSENACVLVGVAVVISFFLTMFLIIGAMGLHEDAHHDRNPTRSMLLDVKETEIGQRIEALESKIEKLEDTNNRLIGGMLHIDTVDPFIDLAISPRLNDIEIETARLKSTFDEAIQMMKSKGRVLDRNFDPLDELNKEVKKLFFSMLEFIERNMYGLLGAYALGFATYVAKVKLL